MDINDLDDMYAAYDAYKRNTGNQSKPKRQNNSNIIKKLNKMPQCRTCAKIADLDRKLNDGENVTIDDAMRVCWHCKTASDAELKVNLGYIIYKDGVREREHTQRIDSQMDMISDQQSMLGELQAQIDEQSGEIAKLKRIIKKYKERLKESEEQQQGKWTGGRGKRATATKRYGKTITTMYCRDNIPAYKISTAIGVCDRTVRKVIKDLGLKRGVMPDNDASDKKIR